MLLAESQRYFLIWPSTASSYSPVSPFFFPLFFLFLLHWPELDKAVASELPLHSFKGHLLLRLLGQSSPLVAANLTGRFPLLSSLCFLQLLCPPA